MADVVDKVTRSRMMSGIRGKDTRPELTIRAGLFALGYRYRLHDARLPGKPDIVFPKYRSVIQVHGCFWHGHRCYLFKWPKTRAKFWRDKILGNRRTDKAAMAALNADGWRVLTVWECAIKGRRPSHVRAVLSVADTWLRSRKRNKEIGEESSFRARPNSRSVGS